MTGYTPAVGADWIIRQNDGIVASASMGFVQWKPQPSRPRAAPLTAEEKAILAENPYAHLEPVAASYPADPVVPPGRQKKQEAPLVPFQQTQAEIDDPFGLKARAAATTAELQAKLPPPDKE